MAVKTVDLGPVIGPQGPVGPQGPKGATGATGPQGPAGADGVGIGKAGTGANAEIFNALHNIALGAYSHAEGLTTEARGEASHVEGADTYVIDAARCGHAEGSETSVCGKCGHAEGNQTFANGYASHAEGSGCSASGSYSHVEGVDSTVSGFAAHAGGEMSHANANYAFAHGFEMMANNFAAMAIGHCGKEMTGGGLETDQVGDAFVIGNGDTSVRSNAFRVTYAGAVYGKGSFQTSGADYAEYFEWLDQNPQGQDRVGYFVTLEGERIKLAGPGDWALGIVSADPCIIGNADEDWLGRIQRDGFGRPIREYLVTDQENVTPPDGLADKELRAWMRENRVKKTDEGYVRETVRVVDYETPSWRFRENPDYDPSQPYIERKDRPEWDPVGMLGVLAVREDGTCRVNGFCQVGEGGIATAAEGYVPGQTWRVIGRVDENVVKVVFR